MAALIKISCKIIWECSFLGYSSKDHKSHIDDYLENNLYMFRGVVGSADQS